MKRPRKANIPAVNLVTLGNHIAFVEWQPTAESISCKGSNLGLLNAVGWQPPAVGSEYIGSLRSCKGYLGGT